MRTRTLSASAHDIESARHFHDSCREELLLVERVTLWAEWVDLILARRFATSQLLVGGVAGLIVLLA